MAATVSCSRCGASFKNSYLLTRHLKRTRVCPPVLSDNNVQELITELEQQLSNERDHACKFCNAKFMNKSHLYRHQSRCLPLTIDNISITKDPPTVLKVNAFGNEDMKHVTKAIVHRCLLNRSKGLFELITIIYFSSEVPKNDNIQLHSKKSNRVKIVNNSGDWEITDASDCMRQMIRKGSIMMSDYFTSNDKLREEDETGLIFRFLDGIASRRSNDYHYVSRMIMAFLENRRRGFKE